MLWKVSNMTCQVCMIREKNYKCPRCLLPYCSVECWKKHREVTCESVLSTVRPTETTYSDNIHSCQYKTESYVPVEKLKLMENSEGLKEVLRNPHVRNILLTVDKSGNPAEAMEKAMIEPIFVEFADECLKVVQPETEPLL